jgi:hypothetical protein
MVLSREKRSNAGKAPQRLNQAIPSTLPPSAQLKTSKKTVERPRQTSVVSQASQGSKASKKAPPAPLKRLILALKKQGTQPADLRHEEDISTALPSPEPLLSDDEGFQVLGEGTAPQKEAERVEEEEEEKEEIEEISPPQEVFFKLYYIK